MMVRRVLVLVLVLVLAAVAWPVYVGMQVERALSEIRSGSVGDLRLEHRILNYRRDNFQARATSELRVVDEHIDFTVHLEHQIRHRLLGAAMDTRLAAEQPSGELPVHWHEVLVQAQPRADTWLGLGGGVSSRISTRPVRTAWTDSQFENDVSIHLEVADGKGGLAYSAERLVLSFDTESLHLAVGDQRMEIGDLHYGLLVHPELDGRFGVLPDFDLGLGAERLRLEQDGKERLSAQSLQVSSWQNSSGGHLDTLVRLRAKALRAAGIELDQGLDLHLNALRWHRPTLLRFLAFEEELRGMELAADARASLALGAVLEGLQQMIAHDPRFLGGLTLNGEPARNLRLQFELGLRGDAQRIATRPLETLDLHLDLEAGMELVDQLANAVGESEALQDWLKHGIEEGWIELRDGQLSARLRMDEGRLMINDGDRTVLLLALVFALGQGMF